ncbi:MAG: hypothetical protein HQL27_02120 [Candidatus Omnitrophica bacterium]|nr:hypothetical protein [Candidatus Omnitrophota bacterium]
MTILIKRFMQKITKDKRGSLLLISYMVIMVLLGIGAAFMVLLTNETKVAERERINTVAFHIAEAGIERGLYDLRRDFVIDSTPSWADSDINGYAIGPDYNNFYQITYSDTAFNGGSYSVQLKNDSGTRDIWLRSTGTINGQSHTILVYAKMVQVSPWGTAIFAGAGASGSMINGNVDIRGSVVVLGTGLADGDYAVNMGGTAELVGNNYRSIPDGSGGLPNLKAKVPALDTVVVGGETVETLHANLRIKRGMVGLSGSATVGEVNATGNAYKEKVDGIYIVDGGADNWGGNQGAANAHSDNGTSTAWDLGEGIRFPLLTDPDPIDPTKTFQQYFQDHALVLTNELSNLTAKSSFNYSNANGSIRMDGKGNMTISGRVYVDGNNALLLNSQGIDKTVTYTGTGTLLVTGDITMDVDLITPGNASFPNNIVGFMTPRRINLSTGAQRNVMGLFYAADRVVVARQTNIVGTIVSNYFDMGTNVPAIFQVPQTVNSMPPGMVGASSNLFIVVSWQKI